jgi:hypothetical protein
MARWRDRLLTRKVGDAMTSPSALVLAGVGVAGGIVVGLPIVAAAAIGAAAWAVRVAVAVPRGPSKPRIDAGSLREPWRGFVRAAQQSQHRFDRAVTSMAEGPVRDRLAQIGERIDDGVQESWRIACRADDIEQATASLDTAAAQRELQQLQASGETGPAADRTAEALRAQLASAGRLQTVVREARDRLRMVDARLDELVARAVEVSVSAGDTTDPLLAGDVDGLVQEIESLRLALEETRPGGPLDNPGRGLDGGGAGGSLPPPATS